MDKFLNDVASFLFTKYEGNVADLTVVFPNRRAGLFFQKYLSQQVEKPIFSPSVVTISELVSTFSNLKTDDPNSLIISLWETYTSITGLDESLDDFYYWGEMLLADFNDIDNYLVDAGMLFRNIVSLKEIDSGFDFLTEEQIEFLSAFWENILQVRSSEQKSSFLNIWSNLYPMYVAFKEKLQQRGLAYSGMVYREMVTRLPEMASQWQGRKVAVVGFNALNNCEKKLFDFIKVNCDADFFWDYDQYYLGKGHHEAALFIGANLKRFPSPPGFQFNSSLFESCQSIELVEVPGFSGQAIYASQWLHANRESINGSFDNTAVVLCDESLLPPVLSSLPASVGELNITMGFPFKNSVVYALLKGLIDIDRNGRANESGEVQFYYRNVLALLNSPLIKPALGDFPDRLGERIRKENKIYVTKSDMAESSLLQTIFEIPIGSGETKAYLHQIISHLFSVVHEDDMLTKESLYQLYLLVTRLHNSVLGDDSPEKKIVSKKLFYQLLLRAAEKMAIPFEGEPLSGMQVMGFLETRCLDFDNLILLSFNDDKLPGKQHQHSFIPYSLRKGFDLPVVEQRNAIYAYYFYRLIQRAQKITLVYDSRTEGLSNGEICRYATQLRYEASHLKMIQKQGVFTFDSTEYAPVTVSKNQPLLEKLRTLFSSKTISPTLLNTYLDCRLSFYFRYVEGIRESDDVFEEIDHLIFGRIAHLVMEGLYRPYLTKTITAATIKTMIGDKELISFHLKEALKKEFFKGGNFDMNGKNLLIYGIIEKYVLRILSYDQQIAPFEIVGLEAGYSSQITVETLAGPLVVRIGGTIDRLDRVNGKIRVVDYKTGKSDPMVKSIESLFQPTDKRNKAAFQTMVYARGVNEQLLPSETIVPAVYGARAVFTSDFNPVFQLEGNDLDYRANAEEFDGYLSSLLSGILDPDQPFSQVADVQKCSHCPYNAICNR